MDLGDEVCYNSLVRTVDTLANALKIKRTQTCKTKVNETSLSQQHLDGIKWKSSPLGFDAALFCSQISAV